MKLHTARRAFTVRRATLRGATSFALGRQGNSCFEVRFTGNDFELCNFTMADMTAVEACSSGILKKRIKASLVSRPVKINVCKALSLKFTA
jgi:hypothetical protein